MKLDRATGHAPPASYRELLVVLVIALTAAGISFFIAHAVLEGIPHVSDEIAYLFQARIFLSGRLCLQPPALPNLFQLQNVVLDSTRWCAKYPPGWLLILVPGIFIGAPTLVNPILLALSIIGIWQLGRRLFDPRTGILAAGALGFSPFLCLWVLVSCRMFPPCVLRFGVLWLWLLWREAPDGVLPCLHC